jgi:Tol biopolymer transport system component
MGESFGDVANVFRYSFAAQEPVRLTDFASGWARRLAVAPDGSRVVFEYQSTGDGWDGAPETDLYTMNIDGSDQQLLVANGRSPAWGPQALPGPVQFNHWLFVPLTRR